MRDGDALKDVETNLGSGLKSAEKGDENVEPEDGLGAKSPS